MTKPKRLIYVKDFIDENNNKYFMHVKTELQKDGTYKVIDVWKEYPIGEGKI